MTQIILAYYISSRITLFLAPWDSRTRRELWECISMFSQVTKFNLRYRTFSLRFRSQPKRYKWLIVKVKETIQLIKEERNIRRYRRSTRVERSLAACGPCGLRVLWGFKLGVPFRSQPFLCNSWSGFEFWRICRLREVSSAERRFL